MQRQPIISFENVEHDPVGHRRSLGSGLASSGRSWRASALGPGGPPTSPDVLRRERAPGPVRGSRGSLYGMLSGRKKHPVGGASTSRVGDLRHLGGDRVRALCWD